MSLQPATPNDYTVPVSDNDWAQMLQSNREAQELLSNAIAHHQEQYEDPSSAGNKRIGHGNHLHHKSDHYNRMNLFSFLVVLRKRQTCVFGCLSKEYNSLTAVFLFYQMLEEPSANGQFSDGEGSSGEFSNIQILIQQELLLWFQMAHISSSLNIALNKKGRNKNKRDLTGFQERGQEQYEDNQRPGYSNYFDAPTTH